MADVFLAFQWTSEREAKYHIGVYSTLEKAQQACQLMADEDRFGWFSDDPPRQAPVPLEWVVYRNGTMGAELEFGSDENALEIERFPLDVVMVDDTNYSEPPYEFKRKALEL